MIDRDLLGRTVEGLRSELGVETPFYIYELIRELEEHYFSTPSDATDKPAVFRYKEDPSDLRSRWLYATKEKSIPKGFPYESLYTHPPKPEPARKPMTEEEIDKTMESWQSRMDVRSDARWGAGFKSGIRFAEKHHGIGVDDNG
jgi:hypothetical protein